MITLPCGCEVVRACEEHGTEALRKFAASQPAYPVLLKLPDDGEEITALSPGLTKREYFAVMALQGLFANSITGDHHQPAKRVKLAVEAADDLLAELAKVQS